MKHWLTSISLCLLTVVLCVGVAEAAGTVKVTLKFKDANGVEQPLTYAYAYLRNGDIEPPREKYFSPATYIIGPSNYQGSITASVPAGNYYMRITRRNPIATRPLGPPEPGDYTWFHWRPITISDNTITDLGTKFASIFGGAPIVISGTVKTYNGTPLAGRIVKATIVPCEGDGYYGIPTNYCGPEKHIALQRTDANGNYKLFLRNAGTFYLYESTCLGDQHEEYQGNPCVGYGTGPVTVNIGEQKTVDILGY